MSADMLTGLEGTKLDILRDCKLGGLYDWERRLYRSEMHTIINFLGFISKRQFVGYRWWYYAI